MKNSFNIIKYFEGCELNSYLCPSNVWTIGYGHTKDVKPYSSISQQEADEFLKEDLDYFRDEAIYSIVGFRDLTTYQQEALISFIFNVGMYTFKHSSVYKYMKESNKQKICESLILYVKSFNKPLLGLQRRRLTESALFLNDLDYDDFYYYEPLDFNDVNNIKYQIYFDIIINRLVSLNYIFDFNRADLCFVVKKFQEDNGLVVDGIFGINTSLKLILKNNIK